MKVTNIKLLVDKVQGEIIEKFAEDTTDEEIRQFIITMNAYGPMTNRERRLYENSTLAEILDMGMLEIQTLTITDIT